MGHIVKTYFLCGDQSAYSVTLLFTVWKVLYTNIMKNVNLVLKIQLGYINVMLSCIKCFNLNLTFLNILTLCKLGKFSCFSCCLLHLYMYIASRFFNKKNPKNSFKEHSQNHPVGPDLDPNCLQRLSADDKSAH